MFQFGSWISLIVAMVGFTLTARATPITFSLQNGTYGSGAKMTGTVVIDTATGTMVSADLTYTLSGSSVTFNQNFSDQGIVPALYGVYYPLSYGDVVDGPGNPNATPPTADDLGLLLPVGSLVGYSGGDLCTDNGPSGHYCGGGIFSEYYGRVNFVIDHGLSAPGDDALTTGSLVPLTATTPEPSAWMLTLTGIALCSVISWRGMRLTAIETTLRSQFVSR